MRYETLLSRAGDLPLIDTQTLRVWGGEPRALSVQLSRWARQGKLLPLRRGKYLLPESLRRARPPAEYLANLLVTPSYVSLERALAFHGLIPERVPLVQSITTAKPCLLKTATGDFRYHHVKHEWFFGYSETDVGGGSALIASPEKALLDLAYLHSGRITDEWLDSLRLQELEQVNLGALRHMSEGRGPRLESAGAALSRWIRRERR